MKRLSLICIACFIFYNDNSYGNAKPQDPMDDITNSWEYSWNSEWQHSNQWQANWQYPIDRQPEDNWQLRDLFNTPKKSQDAESAALPLSTNPCDPFNLPKPNFTVPYRRLSEIKCYEAIWELRYREEKTQRDDDCANEKSKKSGGHGILAGRDVTPGEFPHMAAIGWKAVTGTWIFKCGGTLISSKFVLTAAHCSSSARSDTSVADRVPRIVRMGDKNIIDNWSHGVRPIDVNISRIIIHPQYASPNKYYDIALLELQKETEFSKLVHPACLWNVPNVYHLGNKGFVTGWGVVESGGKTTSPTLQAAEVDLIDSNTCNQLLRPSCYRLWCGVQSHQMCAGMLGGGADTCQGDSGGPLSIRIPLPASTKWALHYVLGVTSFGFQCGQVNAPGVYTRVSSFLDWIEQVVWKN